MHMQHTPKNNHSSHIQPSPSHQHNSTHLDLSFFFHNVNLRFLLFKPHTPYSRRKTKELYLVLLALFLYLYLYDSLVTLAKAKKQALSNRFFFLIIKLYFSLFSHHQYQVSIGPYHTRWDGSAVCGNGGRVVVWIVPHKLPFLWHFAMWHL